MSQAAQPDRKRSDHPVSLLKIDLLRYTGKSGQSWHLWFSSLKHLRWKNQYRPPTRTAARNVRLSKFKELSCLHFLHFLIINFEWYVLLPEWNLLDRWNSLREEGHTRYGKHYNQEYLFHDRVEYLKILNPNRIPCLPLQTSDWWSISVEIRFKLALLI